MAWEDCVGKSLIASPIAEVVVRNSLRSGDGSKGGGDAVVLSSVSPRCGDVGGKEAQDPVRRTVSLSSNKFLRAIDNDIPAFDLDGPTGGADTR